MTGKEKCELLKSIRKNIAEMNGIDYEPEECNHQGNCPGFCPRCDAEADWLMHELRKKEAAGSPIRIDTESLGDFETLVSEPIEEDDEEYTHHTIGLIAPPVKGDIPCPEPVDVETLQGDVCETDWKDDDTEEDTADGEELLQSRKDDIERMCNDCIRYATIKASKNGIRCSCLSEYFFKDKLNKGVCSLKQISDEDPSDL